MWSLQYLSHVLWFCSGEGIQLPLQNSVHGRASVFIPSTHPSVAMKPDKGQPWGSGSQGGHRDRSKCCDCGTSHTCRPRAARRRGEQPAEVRKEPQPARPCMLPAHPQRVRAGGRTHQQVPEASLSPGAATRCTTQCRKS